MQFIDLAAQQQRIRRQIDDNIKKVLDHGQYIMGPEIRTLEERLAAFCGVNYAVGVGSGTDALMMSLMALGVGPGDAVFTSDFTFIATAEVIRLINATPVFVDIDPGTYNISPRGLEEAVEKVRKEGRLVPRAVIPVDIFGLCADYPAIESLARRYKMAVLQDAAQSFGASCFDRMACSFGDIAATSFFPAKPLGAYGDGGMIFTSRKELYERLISIRVHGMGVDKYENVRLGINGRLDSIQAAVLLAKCDIFEEELQLRRKVADTYRRLLGDRVKTPSVPEGYTSAWAQYSIESDERDNLMDVLKKEGVPTAIYYKIPLHLQKVFAGLGYRAGDFPVSEEVSKRIFSIPMHPYLKPEEQQRIAEVIRGF